MDYNKLGESGLVISRMSYGTWLSLKNSSEGFTLSRQLLTMAYDAGINAFDTADWYGHGESETVMGKILGQFPRHTLIISSKAFLPMSHDVNDKGLSRKHIMESVEKSLTRLNTDYIDIYYAHRYDTETPLIETMRAMDDLIHQGKILYWGTSKWKREWIEDAIALAEKYHLYPPIVEQPNYSLLIRDTLEDSLIPMAEETGTGLITYSPLAGGLLTGKYDDGIPEGTRFADIEWLKDRYYSEESIERTKKLKPIADALGISRAELAIAWCLANPGNHSVIIGATKVHQLESNLRAMNVDLDDSVMKELEKIFPCEPWALDTNPDGKKARRALS